MVAGEESTMAELRSQLLCRLEARLAAPRDFGDTPQGHRRFFPVVGGIFEGAHLRGEVLPEGGDWAILRSDGTLELDVRITLRTDDGALLYVRYRGVRRAPPEVLARLTRGEIVNPGEYYFRTTPTFETSAPRYTWLNGIVAVGLGERRPPDVVAYSIFEVL
jgi:hypothetical protein